MIIISQNELLYKLFLFVLVIILVSTVVGRYPGSTFIDHVLRYQDNDDVKMIVVLGEVCNSLAPCYTERYMNHK